MKGYEIAFSIDSSFDNRIAFKFTIKNDGVVIGAELVRKDFREYVKQVRDGNLDELDNMPIITSIDEHNLLVALLKNRISFLRHSYELSQNAVQFYLSILNNLRSFPVLPAPSSIIVQTGGNMDSRNYKATNSSRLIQGESNSYSDSSVNIEIGRSFNEKQTRIAQLDDVLRRLESLEDKNEASVKATKELSKVKEELTEYEEPNASAIQQWMQRAKQLLATAALGAEITDAAHKLFQLFGI